MQAIITKFLCPTLHKGARIKALSSLRDSLVISYRPELTREAAHRLAATALCARLGWSDDLVSGDLPGGAGYAFCFRQQ